MKTTLTVGQLKDLIEKFGVDDDTEVALLFRSPNYEEPQFGKATMVSVNHDSLVIIGGQ